MNQLKYPSKVLLFGEYTVLLGGTALAVPYPHYSGQWRKFEGRPALDSAFLHYISRLGNRLNHPIDISRLKSMLEEGWRFDSSIPQGMGLGSSGALTAAIYDSFASQNPYDLHNIRHDLASMESFFHGKSSGLDALVSYTHKTIRLGTDSTVEIIRMPSLKDHIQLLNSDHVRETALLVKWYRTALKDAHFMDKMLKISSLATRAIEVIVSGESVLKLVKEISRLQFLHMKYLIPDPIKKIWEETLDNSDVAIKLCGAGGGGFFLVFTSDSAKKLEWSVPLSKLVPSS